MAILAAALALAFFVLAGIVVDLSMARDQRLKAQTSADAAALAGVNALYASGTADKAAAVAAAQTYALQNYGIAAAEWATCTDPGRSAYPGFSRSTETDCISFKPSANPTEMRVRFPVRTVRASFGSLAGVSSVPVAAEAHAEVTPGGSAVCGLCVIGTGAHDFQNGNVTVAGASVYVNGTLDNRNNGSVVATGTGATIKLQETGNDAGKGTFSPTPIFSQPQLSDPLAFLTLPPNMTALSAKTGTVCTSGPGIYKSLGSIGSNCSLSPGLYVVTGTNHYSGQDAITANGVTFYFTCQDTSTTTPKVRACNSNESGGDLLMTGQASLTINPQTSGALAGMSLVSDRNNTAEIGFRGNGVGTSSGTIYLKNGALDYRGNGAGLVLESLVVVKDLDFSGNPSAINLKYTQSKNVTIPAGELHLSH